MKTLYTVVRFVTVLAIVCSASALAQIYKWVDEKGVTHYGERPPDIKKSKSVNVRDSPPASKSDDTTVKKSEHSGEMTSDKAKILQECQFRQRQAIRHAQDVLAVAEFRYNPMTYAPKAYGPGERPSVEDLEEGKKRRRAWIGLCAKFIVEPPISAYGPKEFCGVLSPEERQQYGATPECIALLSPKKDQATVPPSKK